MRRQLHRAASSGKLSGSSRGLLFLPRGVGQADRVRAVDLAANNVGLPLDVLRRSDASPAAVLGVVVCVESFYPALVAGPGFPSPFRSISRRGLAGGVPRDQNNTGQPGALLSAARSAPSPSCLPARPVGRRGLPQRLLLRTPMQCPPRSESDRTAALPRARLFNHLVCYVEQPRRNGQSEDFSRLEVDDERELGRLLDGKIGRLGTLRILST